MPDPRKLKVGDRIRYFTMPEELLSQSWSMDAESYAFIEALIERSWSQRIARIDEHGYPWFDAITVEKDGTRVYHF